MSIFFILIIVVIVIFGLGFAFTLWFASRQTRGLPAEAQAQETAKKLTFRWRYITLPIIVAIVFIIIGAVFFPRLPAEIGYHFRADGTPDRWLSKEMAMALMLAPQLLLALLAGATIRGMTKLNILPSEGSGIDPEKLLSRIGNLVALPQIVIGLVIVDIFTYNAVQVHLMPTWAFLLILGIATIALVLILILTLRKTRKHLMPQQ
jgi:uncharacterized membrane protein